MDDEKMRKNTAPVSILLAGMVFVITLLFYTTAYAATYYVDYDSGDDRRTGASEAEAWQHAPGDLNATGVADATALNPDDQVLFRGGVRYQGTITIQSSGESTMPIRYTGNGWGTERAIIDGGSEFGDTWTPCASAQECGGNPNYMNIYYTAAPEGTDLQSGFFEDGELVWAAQDPNPPDRFHYDRTDGLRVIPFDDPAVFHGRTAITDPRHLTSDDPNEYSGAYVLVWHIPNVTNAQPVTGFDPDTDTLYHADLGNDVYDDRNTYYAVVNHLGALDSPGEFVVDEAGGRFYVWPRNSDNPGSHTYTVCSSGAGIFASGRHDLIIEGFKVQGLRMGIRALGRDARNVIIRDNEVTNLFSDNWYAVQAIGDNMAVENNRVENCVRAVGILLGGSDITVTNNYVRRTSRQGIWLMGVERASVIDNTVVEMKGTHSNGISVYLHHENVLIARNQIIDCNSALTYHGDGDPDHVNNLVIYNNLVSGPTNSWGNDMRGVTIANNTFLGPVGIPSADQEIVFINNIVHGGGGGDVRSHNLYTDLMWNQADRYGWSPGPGEILEVDAGTTTYSPIDPATVFEDIGSDHHLSADSLAIDSGTDIRSYLPTALFPEVDFSLDLDGKPRPQGGGWDMGAYEIGDSQASTNTGEAQDSGSGGCFVLMMAN